MNSDQGHKDLYSVCLLILIGVAVILYQLYKEGMLNLSTSPLYNSIMVNLFTMFTKGYKMLEVLVEPKLSMGSLYQHLREVTTIKKQDNETITCIAALADMQDTEATHNILNHFSYTFMTALDLEQLEQLKFKTDTFVTAHKIRQRYLVVFSGTLKTFKLTVVDFLQDTLLHDLGHELRQYFIKDGMSFLWQDYRTKREKGSYSLIEDKRKNS
jgi:hypothetical protein